ncbi:MAG: glycosyltransferase family 39 protein [Chlamydiota bacterium]
MKAGRVLIFLMAVAFLARLPLCLDPPELLIPRVVSDDMFYYLSIARNIAEGRGATADGENTTNGFHPLWALILVALTGMPGSDAHLIRAALVALTLFSVLSAWFLYRMLRCACGEAASLAAAAVWLCCPYPVLVALSGVEVPLYVLLLGAVSCAYLRVQRGSGGGLRAWFALGVLAGVAVLARLDGAVLAAVIAADALAGPGGRGVPVGQRVARAAAFGAACALAVFPWLSWSYARTGFLFQMSGKAIYHQQHVVFWAQNAHASWGVYAISWLSNVLSNLGVAFGTITVICGLSTRAGFAGVVLCGILVAAAAVKDPPFFREWLRRCAGLAFLFCYGLLMALLYCAYLWYSQDWYYYSIVFAACAALGCVLDLMDGVFLSGFPRPARAAAWGTVAVCCAGFFTLKTAAWRERGLRGWQLDMYRAAEWAAENLPRDARIGSFNSGIAAYFCPQRVINLDGVVNGAAYRAVVAGRIFDYVRDERIGYLIESPLSLRFRAVQSPGSPPPLLRPLHVEASYPEARARGNPVVVYEVESRVDENGGRE